MFFKESNFKIFICRIEEVEEKKSFMFPSNLFDDKRSGSSLRGLKNVHPVPNNSILINLFKKKK